MGCGSSKAVETADAPGQRVVDVRAVQQGETLATPAKTTASAPAKGSPQSTADSGIDDDEQRNIITEDTAGGDAIAGKRPPTPELSLVGKSLSRTKNLPGASKSSAAPDDEDESLPDAPPMLSISERPKSRGGMAFDVSFQGEDALRAPRRLEKLQGKKRRRRENLTLAEVQKKLEAAERRRLEYEEMFKAKMAAETTKSRSIRQAAGTPEDAAEKVTKQVDRAQSNREEHMKQLRDRLRAKEEHARKVRENKKALASE